MRFRKKKTKVEDIGDMDYTPTDEFYFQEEAKKNLHDLAQELTERTKRETELIRQHLGIDDKGCCLRHPNQFITSKVQPNRRFESIKICLICDSEIQAGGKAQRKSMTNVLSDLDALIKDKKEWRNKTNILYNGQTILEEEEEEDEDEEEDKNVFKKWEPPSKEEEKKEFQHMLNFYNKEVEEEQAKARKLKNKKKKTTIDDEASEASEKVIEEEDKKWKQEVKERVAHVRAWDGDMALKQNPVYAKYWRMVNVGIPMQAIKNAMESDGLDVRIMSLDPNRPLQDQVDDIPDMSEEERDVLRKGDQLATIRDDDLFEPLTIDETVEMIHRAYERRAYFMQELEDELNPEKQKLSKKLLKKLGKGVRAPPPPLIEPKRRELPPKEEEEEDAKEEESKPEEPPATASPKSQATPPPTVPRPETPKGNSSRVSFSAEKQVVTTEDIDRSIHKGKKGPDTPSSMSTITQQDFPTPTGNTPSPMMAAATPTSFQTPPQPMVFFPDPDDKLPEFQVVKDDGDKKKVKKRFKGVTKLGATKYEVARTKQELNQVQKELATRTVIIGSLKTQLENLEKELNQKERQVEEMKQDLYDLDPNDPLVSTPRSSPRNLEETKREEGELTVASSPFREVDRSDVVKARMQKLSILPRRI